MVAWAALKTKAKLINWQYHLFKWGLIATLVVGWTYHWYDKGITKCQTEQLTEQSAQLTADIENRMPVVHQAERRAAQLEQELRTMKEKLDEEARKPYATDCSVNDNQLRLYRELSEKTKR